MQQKNEKNKKARLIIFKTIMSSSEYLFRNKNI